MRIPARAELDRLCGAGNWRVVGISAGALVESIFTAASLRLMIEADPTGHLPFWGRLIESF